MKRLVYIISTFLILTGMYGGNVGADLGWCATKKSFWTTTPDSCNYWSGSYFISIDDKELAEAEHKRLKAASSIASSSSSTASSALAMGWCSEPEKSGVSLWFMGATNCKGKLFGSYNEAVAEYNRVHGIVHPEKGPYDTIWCANNLTFAEYKKRICDQIGGKAYSSKYLARAEYNRLKAASSDPTTTASSSSSTASSSNSIAYCYDKLAQNYYSASDGICFSSDKIISKQEYESEPWKKIWCATQMTVAYIAKVECKAKGGQDFSTYTAAQTENKRLNSTSTIKVPSSESKKVWCVSRGIVDYRKASSCKARGGKGYSSIELAHAEQNRLKVSSSGSSSTASSSSSTTSPPTQTAQTTTVQSSAVDKTAEIEFWKSVKDSTDPDMYRAYIDEFPTGVYVKLAKIKLKKLGGDTSSIVQSLIPNLDYGDYYALVIGNNDYELLPDLETAVNDATKVASVLEYDYGFKVELLKNASRGEILKSLFGYRKVVGERDNLLIYYAGHGELDEGAKKGYWLPVDAARDDPSNWVMTDQVVAQITAMEAKHVMVVADSCFSGELTRGIKIDYGSPNWVQKLVKKKARIALTSGGLEPVSDSGGGSHSVFAKVFISLLEENMGVLNTQKLFSELRPRVMKNTRQTPEHGTIHLAGDDGGDFLFVRQ